MASTTPSIIDLNAEAAKLTIFRGITPQTTSAERRGSMARLGTYRDGILLLGKSAGGKGHWETHAEDELLHILQGERTLDIVETDGPHSYAVGAGMIAIVPAGAWHRVRSTDVGMVMSATLPGAHIELDVDDPRTVEPGKVMAGGSPRIVDLAAELAKLKMFRRTPQSTREDTKGSVANLAPYRDGLLLAIKASGTDHWERHLTGDELVHILDGSAMLEIVCDDGPPKSFELRTGMVAVIPRAAWHRLLSPGGATQIAVTPFPGETLERDVDDPRTIERKPA
jgi:mannose-6-phosphate isomerase-like protein (cupin superfamily)